MAGGGAAALASSKRHHTPPHINLRLLATLPKRHTDRIWCAAWQPTSTATANSRGGNGDIGWLATCGGDTTIRIWAPCVQRKNSLSASDRKKISGEISAAAVSVSASPAVAVWKTCDCIAVLDGVHSRTVRSVAWSPCGRFLAACGFDRITSIWAAPMKGERSAHVTAGGVDGSDQDDMMMQDDLDFDGSKAWECIATLEGHENEVKCVRWSKSGTLLATCSRDKSVWIWEASPLEREFECASVLHGHAQDVKFVAWHPSGDDTLLSASYDDTVRVWTEQDDDWYGTETLQAHTSTVWALAFDPSSSPSLPRMVTCSDDSSIMLWQQCRRGNPNSMENFDGWKKLQTIGVDKHTAHGHQATVYSVDWSPRRWIASAGSDNAICIYAIDEEAKMKAEPTQQSVPAAAGKPSRNIYKRAVRVELAHALDVNCVQWHPRFPDILTSCGDDELVRIWQCIQEEG